MCTGMIARVRGVIRRAASAGSRVERLVHLGHHGNRAHRQDGRGAGNPGIGGQDHLVAGPNAQRAQGAHQRCRPGGDCQGAARALERGEALLQLLHLARAFFWSVVAEKALGADDLEHGPLFGFVEQVAAGVHGRVGGSAGRLAAVNGQFHRRVGVAVHGLPPQLGWDSLSNLSTNWQTAVSVQRSAISLRWKRPRVGARLVGASSLGN